MENWEDKNLRVNTPDSIIQSHRDGLRSKLGKTSPRHNAGKSLLVMGLAMLVGLGSLTAAYPSWAKDLYKQVIVRSFTFHGDDGSEIHIKTIQTECEPGDGLCDSLLAGMENIRGAQIRKYVIDANDPKSQMIKIDAEIIGKEGYEFDVKKIDSFDDLAEGKEQKLVISSADCGLTWVVNGDTATADETIETIQSDVNILEVVEREYAATTDAEPVIASSFELGQNYPNPFNPTTQIPFDLKESGQVTLKVYNLMGQEVATLINGFETAGHHSVAFNGAGLPSGVYVYAMEAGDYKFSKQMTLTK